MSDEGPRGKGSNPHSDALAPTVAEMAQSDTIAATTTGSGNVDVSARTLRASRVEERYVVRSELGAGGMGQVQLCRDEVVGRQVAMKTMHGHHSQRDDSLARFLREARVQGQLEHPAIVPVYDLGSDEAGNPYFTMKRLKGMTLHTILGRLRDGDGETTATYTTHKLLSEFGQVCQAIEYAHARGVVHRDLKPENIMLGDFGEVYVLDWGIAKIAGVDDQQPDSGDGLRIDTGEITTEQTAHGAVLGTPGYMAPEQIRGDVSAIDARTDVYALGAILFEVLTLKRLHRGTTAQELINSTTAGADAAAAERAPDRDIAPELEAICVRATATQPGDRFASARELFDAVEGYLAGDRDLTRRRALATECAEAAAALARDLLANKTDDDEARRNAMRQASRAIALDPSNEQAAHVITQLMLTPPTTTPADVERSLFEAKQKRAAQHVRRAALIYLSCFSFIPLYLWMGIKSWTIVGLQSLTILACAAIAAIGARPGVINRRLMSVALLINLAFMIVLSRGLGWFILLPAVTTASTMAFLFHRHLQNAWITISAGCAAMLIPFALELTGVFSTSYSFADGRLIVSSAMLHLHELPVIITMAVTGVVLVAGTAALVITHMNDIDAAERQVHLQAWQLRQLVPESTATAG